MVSQDSPRDKAKRKVQTLDIHAVKEFLAKDPLQSDLLYVYMLQDLEDLSNDGNFDTIQRIRSAILEQIPKPRAILVLLSSGYESDFVSFNGVFRLFMKQIWSNRDNKYTAVLEAMWRDYSDQVMEDQHIVRVCVDTRCHLILKKVLSKLSQRSFEERDRYFHYRVHGVHGLQTALYEAFVNTDDEAINQLLKFRKLGKAATILLHPNEAPLHAAVKVIAKKQVDKGLRYLDEILRIAPQTLCESRVQANSPDKQTAYEWVQYWQSLDCESEPLRKAESRLKHAIFHLLGGDIDRIHVALYGNKGKNKEVFLHLSDLSQPTHSFERFVKELSTSEKSRKQREKQPVASKFSSSHLRFEDTLLYLRLPDFRRVVSHSKEQRMAVAYLFEWLSLQNVRTIIDCIIPDSLLCPLDDDFITKNLFQRFSIERLDWRKLDLNLDLLLRLKMKDWQCIEEMKLYSSGNWGVLFYWASVDGLCQFFLQRLKKVSVSFVQPRCSDDEDSALFKERFSVYKTKFLTKLAESQATLWAAQNLTGEQMKALENLTDDQKMAFDPKKIQWEKMIEMRSEPYPWDFFTTFNAIPSKVSKQLGIFDDFRACNTFLDRVKRFAEESNLQKRSLYSNFVDIAIKVIEKPIKIAIIDNGTDSLRSTIANNIADGISFMEDEDGRRLPWWTVSDPHGTQMASLIQQVNPHCLLYCARVGKERNDIKHSPAEKAVRWAIEHNVDIISMSWTTESQDSGLRSSLQDAAERSLVFCACDDKGARENTLAKTLSDQLIRIGAANSVHRARLVSDNTVDFMVDGEEILADGPKYMESQMKQNITGSSVATALAAGIASLALVLFKIANASVLAEDAHLRKTMRSKAFCVKLFKKMLHENDHDKVLDPSIIFTDHGFAVDADTAATPSALEALQMSKVDPNYKVPNASQPATQEPDDTASGSDDEFESVFGGDD